jgi:hypothetical protein
MYHTHNRIPVRDTRVRIDRQNVTPGVNNRFLDEQLKTNCKVNLDYIRYTELADGVRFDPHI